MSIGLHGGELDREATLDRLAQIGQKFVHGFALGGRRPEWPEPRPKNPPLPRRERWP